MFKTIKKVLPSALSILGISFLFWIVFLLNPSLSYAHETEFEFVKVYHNSALEKGTKDVLNDAVKIIKTSALFDEDVSIQLCMNDDKIYPHLNPLVGDPLAFAMLDKTTIKNCKANFDDNIAETQWAINNYELRQFNLTWLLAHEFMHNLQFKANFNYVATTTIGKINWKLEGHADYISRQFKNDGKLKQKISFYLIEEKKEHIGLPVFDLEDGTKQIMSYYKYALIIQYLMEEKNLNFYQICDLEKSMDLLYAEMIAWSSEK